MEWYVEFDFIEAPKGKCKKKIPMSMKYFATESEAVQFAELETSDGEIGYMEKEE